MSFGRGACLYCCPLSFHFLSSLMNKGLTWISFCVRRPLFSGRGHLGATGSFVWVASHIHKIILQSCQKTIRFSNFSKFCRILSPSRLKLCYSKYQCVACGHSCAHQCAFTTHFHCWTCLCSHMGKKLFPLRKTEVARKLNFCAHCITLWNLGI